LRPAARCVKANRTAAGSLSEKPKVVPIGGWRCLVMCASLLPARHFLNDWVRRVMTGRETTLSVMVTVFESSVPSLALKLKLSGPR